MFVGGDSGLCIGCDTVELRRAIAKGEAAKAAGMARTVAAAGPGEIARVDAAIRRLAATGRPFSANDMRADIEGVKGSRVGARFNALAQAGVIREVGRTKSTLANTHAHEIKVWQAA